MSHHQPNIILRLSQVVVTSDCNLKKPPGNSPGNPPENLSENLYTNHLSPPQPNPPP